jgi:hypothetical protein
MYAAVHAVGTCRSRVTWVKRKLDCFNGLRTDCLLTALQVLYGSLIQIRVRQYPSDFCSGVLPDSVFAYTNRLGVGGGGGAGGGGGGVIHSKATNEVGAVCDRATHEPTLNSCLGSPLPARRHHVYGASAAAGSTDQA